MSNRIYIILLSLFLTLQAEWTEAGLNVTTCLRCSSNDVDSIIVRCKHDGAADWTMGAKLISGDKTICETFETAACKWSKYINYFEFTLKNLTSEQKKQQYECMVYRRDPLPIMTVEGKKIQMHPELCSPSSEISCNCVMDHDNPPCAESSSFTSILTWALIGLVFLLCLYSLSVTALYINLRVSKSEDIYDKLTYVPMQVKPKEKLKWHNQDKNTEYMDMREVHPQARPIRDMNHNSQQIPVGFTI